MPPTASKKAATKKPKAEGDKAPTRKKKAKPEAGSIGLSALECAELALPAQHGALKERIEREGGRVLSAYREPLSGHWLLLSALPIERVAPTPYQRELSKTHAQRLGDVIAKVSRCETFRDAPLRETLPERQLRADKLIALDGLVNEAVKKLKESGFTSGYLKPVVVARINPLRFVKQKPGEPQVADFDKTLERMMEGARKFDASKVKAADIALAASMGTSDEG